MRKIEKVAQAADRRLSSSVKARGRIFRSASLECLREGIMVTIEGTKRPFRLSQYVVDVDWSGISDAMWSLPHFIDGRSRKEGDLKSTKEALRKDEELLEVREGTLIEPLMAVARSLDDPQAN